MKSKTYLISLDLELVQPFTTKFPNFKNFDGDKKKNYQKFYV